MSKNEYTKFKKAFGKRLRLAMSENKVFDKQIIDKLDISKYTLRSWKLGSRVPHMLQFRRLCKVLKVKPEILLYPQKKGKN